MYGYVSLWYAIVSEQLINESRSCWVMNFYRILCVFAYGVEKEKNLIGDVMRRKHLMMALAHTHNATLYHIYNPSTFSIILYVLPHLHAYKYERMLTTGREMRRAEYSFFCFAILAFFPQSFVSFDPFAEHRV